MLNLKTIVISLFINVSLLWGLAYASVPTGNFCLEMNNAQWQGIYAWTYRGDQFQRSVIATTTELSPHYHHYTMTMQIENPTPGSIADIVELKGTCMRNQIYLERDKQPNAIYLQGTIDNSGIILIGDRGPSLVTVTLMKQ